MTNGRTGLKTRRYIWTLVDVMAKVFEEMGYRVAADRKNGQDSAEECESFEAMKRGGVVIVAKQ